MFHLESSIASWRQQMLAAGLRDASALDELESHLRDDIEQQTRAGRSVENAFTLAARQIGRAAPLKTEFAKTGETFWEQVKHALVTPVRLPNLQLATNMHTSDSNCEPCWATYARGGTFVFPALFLWLFTAVFVLPKVNQLCQAAGMNVFDFSHAPAMFQATAVVGQSMVFLTAHYFWVGGVVALAFFGLERYYTRWPRYRRAVIGGGVFLVNAVVLLSLTTLIISLVLAAPALLHHAK